MNDLQAQDASNAGLSRSITMDNHPDDPMTTPGQRDFSQLRLELLHCAHQIQALGQRPPSDTAALTDSISNLVRIAHALSQPRNTAALSDEAQLIHDLSRAVHRIEDAKTRDALKNRLAELGYSVPETDSEDAKRS
ncbi:hypothetical protein [Aureimonas sp. AU20]|uniref:hypothetical protein n=1 Tax=Aureimonas sp. AU20 TaxID=1349819 RepID=UPI0007201DD1|nr:hypothetical protein [Aureimonas sp. AU20]ALN75339.1 hypothetical protein M673_21625 [Aureimonas sp. AU20]